MGRRQANRAGAQTVGAATEVIEASFTRPADTTAYAAGDAMSNATATTHVVITFEDCALSDGSSGTVVAALLNSSANVATKLDAELWLFDTEPTAMEDNAAFDPSDPEMLNVIAVIPFTTWYVGTATAGAGGNCISMGDKGIFPFVCQAGKDLYGILVARNAYVPVSGEQFNVRLQIQQD